MADDEGKLLPLFPVPDFVHFPRTELKIHVVEPRYRRMVRDVAGEEDEEQRTIGIVLLKPGSSDEPGGPPPEVFPGGTAGRLVDVEFLADGRSNILLRGEYRFELTRAVVSQPYPQALVRPLAEPRFDEGDAGIQVVRGGLLEAARALAGELGKSFPLSAETVEELAAWSDFEELVNRVAVELDLPALRKLELLVESLPERALSILSILRSRQQVVDLLRPYRHLAAGSQLN